MKNYFRITTYSPEENVSAIIDCHGKFEQLWQFSSFLVKKNFKIRAVSKEEAFDVGNIPKVKPDHEHLILRACQSGEPIIQNNRIEINGRYYFIK
jgi:hypothetical protein